MGRNFFYDSLPGIWCEIDTNSRFLYVNKAYCALVGAKVPGTLIGKTVADLPCDAAECAELFWKEDNKVKESYTEQHFLNVVRLAKNEWKIIKLIKKPIFDDSSNLSSILFHIIVQYDETMQNFGAKMAKALEYQNSTIIKNQYSLQIQQHPLHSISKKEAECLFFLIHGKTYREIAQIQHVSQRTIIDHVERLKIKLGCQSKSELISRAIELGFNYQLPASLLSRQISIAL